MDQNTTPETQTPVQDQTVPTQILVEPKYPWKYIASGLAAVLIIGVGAFLLGKGASNSGDEANLPSPVPTTITQITGAVSPTVNEAIKPGWLTYENTTYGFSIQHSPEVIVGEKDGMISLIKRGPTQKNNTELSDGIALNISHGSLDNQQLREIVDLKVENSKQNGEILEPPHTADNGWLSYKAQGLGTYTYYYVPLRNDDYLEIADGTIDPSNRGHLEEVQTMLSTLKMLN